MKSLIPLLALFVVGSAAAANDPCAGLTHCRVDGSLRSQVVRVAVTDKTAAYNYHTVRSTLRLTNLGSSPLILGYMGDSGQITDDKGLIYKAYVEVAGIGVVTDRKADPQFQLAPGETREMQLQQTLKYSPRQTVVGTRFDQSLTLAQLQIRSEQSIHTQREYALDYPGLVATDGIGAVAAGSTSVVSPVGTVAGGTAPSAATIDACAGQSACQVQGPIAAQIVGVRLTESGTGYKVYWQFHTVYFTVRVRNVSTEPLIVGFRQGSSNLTDDHGLAYTKNELAKGIGLVSDRGADSQFQLAPGQTREFQFQKALEYHAAATVPGSRFNLDFSLARLAVVGPQQVRALGDYAMSFTGLTAGNSYGGLASATQTDATGTTASGATASGAIQTVTDSANKATQTTDSIKSMSNAVKGLFDSLKGKN